jgi:hypothetical protein
MLGQEKVTCIPNQPTDTVKKSILDIGAIVDKRKRFLDLHFLALREILEVGSMGTRFYPLTGLSDVRAHFSTASTLRRH